MINSEKCSKPAWVESKFRANQVLSGKSRNGQFFVLFAKSLRTTLGGSCDLGFCGGRCSGRRGRPPMPNAGQRTQILARVSEILLPTMQEPPLRIKTQARRIAADPRRGAARRAARGTSRRAASPPPRAKQYHAASPDQPNGMLDPPCSGARPYQIRTKPKCPLWLSHVRRFSALAKALHTPEKPYTRQPSARKKPYTGGRAKMTEITLFRPGLFQRQPWKSLFGKLQKCQKSQESTPKRSKRHGRRWKRPGQLGSFFKQHEMGAGVS